MDLYLLICHVRVNIGNLVFIVMFMWCLLSAVFIVYLFVMFFAYFVFEIIEWRVVSHIKC